MNHSVQNIVNVVKASNCLGKSKRQHGLLLYLLEQMELGCSDDITQYGIATEVLGRGKSFDPTTDSIVRVEMHRLRKNLKEFNNTSEDIQIIIPTASFEVIVSDKEKPGSISSPSVFQKPLIYATVILTVSGFGVFSSNFHKDLNAVGASCSSIIPNISVVNSGSEADLQLYVNKLIRSTLTQYSNIRLVDNIADCANSGTPSYTLDYMVFEEKGSHRVAVTTYNEQASNIISFKSINGETSGSDDKDGLYYAIVRTISDLAKPYGSLPRHSMTVVWESKQAASNYECLIFKYDSYTTDTLSDFERSSECLSIAAKTDIASLDIKAAAAEKFLSQARGYHPKTVENPMAMVEQILEDAGERWIDSVEMTTIKLSYEVERPDFNSDRLEETLNVAEAKYSENPLILLFASLYYGYRLGDWDKAKSMSDKIKLIHSETDNSVFAVDAMYALLSYPPEEIMDTCVLTYSEHSLFSNLIINACARRAKNARWLETTENNLSKLGYPDKPKRLRFIQNKSLDESFAAEFMKALNLPSD